MGSNQSNSNFSEVQEISDNISNLTSQTCSETISNAISGNTVIKIGGSGNITLENEATMTSTECDMTVAVQQQINSLLKSSIKSSTSFPAISLSKNNISTDENMSNKIAVNVLNKASQSCNEVINNNSTDNTVIAIDTTGDIVLGNKSTMESTKCMLQSAAQTALTQTADASESAVAKVTSIFAGIVAIFVVGAIFVCVIILIHSMSRGHNNKEKIEIKEVGTPVAKGNYTERLKTNPSTPLLITSSRPLIHHSDKQDHFTSTVRGNTSPTGNSVNTELVHTFKHADSVTHDVARQYKMIKHTDKEIKHIQEHDSNAQIIIDTLNKHIDTLNRIKQENPNIEDSPTPQVILLIKQIDELFDKLNENTFKHHAAISNVIKHIDASASHLEKTVIGNINAVKIKTKAVIQNVKKFVSGLTPDTFTLMSQELRDLTNNNDALSKRIDSLDADLKSLHQKIQTQGHKLISSMIDAKISSSVLPSARIPKGPSSSSRIPVADPNTVKKEIVPPPGSPIAKVLKIITPNVTLHNEDGKHITGLHSFIDKLFHHHKKDADALEHYSAQEDVTSHQKQIHKPDVKSLGSHISKHTAFKHNSENKSIKSSLGGTKSHFFDHIKSFLANSGSSTSETSAASKSEGFFSNIAGKLKTIGKFVEDNPEIVEDAAMLASNGQELFTNKKTNKSEIPTFDDKEVQHIFNLLDSCQ